MSTPDAPSVAMAVQEFEALLYLAESDAAALPAARERERQTLLDTAAYYRLALAALRACAGPAVAWTVRSPDGRLITTHTHHKQEDAEQVARALSGFLEGYSVVPLYPFPSEAP